MSTDTLTSPRGTVNAGGAFVYDEETIDRLLGRTEDARKAANVAADRYSRLAAAESASASAAGRSAEARSDENHPLAAPAAAALPTAQLAAAEGPDDDDVHRVFAAASDIFAQLATLADRFPRTVRKTESGEWVQTGVVANTLDTICAGFERRWERADRAADRALRAFHQADRGRVGGEIDGNQAAKAEDDAIEANDQAQFYRALYDAACRAYELHVGTPWITRQSIDSERATALGLANARLREVTVYTPPRPAATHRVIVMGGGEAAGELLPALERVAAKYPALTLYSGDREKGIERQVATFAMGRCQLVRFGLDREKDGNAAPFRRAERMLDQARPHGVILAGPIDHGPTAHLAKIARDRGIAIWDLRHAPATAG